MGVHIITDAGKEHNYAIILAFTTTNNEVEHEVLLVGLEVPKLLGANEIEVKVDSQVVVNQVQGEFITKSKKLKKYLTLVGNNRSHFRYFHI